MLKKGDRFPTHGYSFNTLRAAGKIYYATGCTDAGVQICMVKLRVEDGEYEVLDTIYCGKMCGKTFLTEIIRHIPLEEAATLVADPWPSIRHAALKRLAEGR